MVGKQVSNLTLAQQLAQALMLEQVRFIKNKCLDTKDTLYLEQFVHQIYSHSDRILLKNVINIEQLNGVVQKYAFELNLGGEILEFIGVVAQKVHQYTLKSSTQFNDLLSDESFEIWMHKVLELEQLRLYIQENLKNNPQAQHVSLQLANQILESNTPWLSQLRKLKTQDQGLSGKVLGFIQDQQHTIELKLEKQLSQAILKQLGHIITLPNEEMAEIVLEIWSDIKKRTLQESFSQLQAIDVEEFFILIYETWKELRETPFMQDIILHVVKSFYDYFADYSLQEMLESVGLTEQDLYLEALRFAPHLFKALEDAGVLDQFIHALFSSFYTAETTTHLIEDFLKNNTN